MMFKAVCLARWRAIAASEPFNAEMRQTELHGRLPSSETARTKMSIVSSDPDWTPQAATLGEARANLREAVEMVLQANRELAEESSKA